MTNPKLNRPGERGEVPGAIRSLLTITYSELRQDAARLFASAWGDADRRRLFDLAMALADACDRQDLRDLGAPARTMARLARVPRKDALVLRKELRAKFDEQLSLADRMLSSKLQRSTG